MRLDRLAREIEARLKELQRRHLFTADVVEKRRLKSEVEDLQAQLFEERKRLGTLSRPLAVQLYVLSLAAFPIPGRELQSPQRPERGGTGTHLRPVGKVDRNESRRREDLTVSSSG
ncbi:MAG: hypothetical protein ABI353_12935 [Isosphaeraceae bacterium]